ncbi:MAG: DUF6093 family protein [Candidatus Nanopelagicales bacterium]
MPLPGSKVIHPKFTENNEPVAKSAMRGTCVIERYDKNSDGWDPVNGANPNKGKPSTVWSGPCRVQRHARSTTVSETGEQLVTETDLLITIPLEVPEIMAGANGDLVTITAADDAALVDIEARVESVAHETESFERGLYCIEQN